MGHNPAGDARGLLSLCTHVREKRLPELKAHGPECVRVWEGGAACKARVWVGRAAPHMPVTGFNVHHTYTPECFLYCTFDVLFRYTV